MSGAGHVVPNPWQALRALTPARIALGRAGVSQPTDAQLAFQLAHAEARDAVHAPLDNAALAAQLPAGALHVHSACPDRATYLQRPDLGRRLDEASAAALAPAPCDLALVVADGLSALAVASHAPPFAAALLPLLAQHGISHGSLVIASQARVAIGDQIGQLLQARAVLVMIGERPGLSSPDSMGLYLSWAPRIGLTDAARNCISNVRPAGLGVTQAADKLVYLLLRARERGLTGVALKDDSAPGAPALARGKANFLLG